MSNKSIYILLSHSGSLISQGLHFITKAKYNHVSLCIEDDLNTFYSFGRKFIYFPLIGGFVAENLNKGTFLHFKNTECCLYKLSVDEENYCCLETKLNHFISNKESYKYDMLGLLGYFIKKPIHRKNRYYCSQFVAHLLTSANIFDLSRDGCFITPNHFKAINNLELVYEGRLRDFVKQQKMLEIFTVNW